MSSHTTRMIEGSILAGNLQKLRLGPVQFGDEARDGNPEGRVGYICTREDGRSVSQAGVFECEPFTLAVTLSGDETVLVLEGELRIELGDGSALDLGPGDLAMLPKGSETKFIYKTRCKELFVVNR
jgi:ethanolamine utilization protein EutQ (cupin superfamily)